MTMDAEGMKDVLLRAREVWRRQVRKGRTKGRGLRQRTVMERLDESGDGKVAGSV